MRDYVLIAIASVCLGGALQADAGARRGGPDPILELPPAARHVIQLEAGLEKVDSVTRTNGADGEVVYDVESIKDGRTRDMTVTAAGKLLDVQVFLGELSIPVERAIKALTDGAELGDITKDVSDPYGDTFDVELTRGGTNRSFTLDENGALLEMQVFLPEIPDAVWQTIRAKLSGSSLGDINRMIDEEDVTYKVEMTNAGRARDFTVSTNGELLEEQVFLNELPASVQKAVQEQGKRGRLGEITKSIDEGTNYYEVNLKIGPHACAVTFDAAGVFQSEEDDAAWADLPPMVMRALKPRQGTAKIADITREIEGTNTTYQITLSDSGVHRTLVFQVDGVVVPP